MLSKEQRRALKNAISRAQKLRSVPTIECQGCGRTVENSSGRRRYCNRACANRHWHVRNREKSRAADIRYHERLRQEQAS